SALLTAAAVTTAGAIGFIGLLVPHAVRLVVGNDQRVLLPAAALAGGALLLVADTLARQIAAPAQLPSGWITALIGVTVLIYLLLRERRSRRLCCVHDDWAGLAMASQYPTELTI